MEETLKAILKKYKETTVKELYLAEYVFKVDADEWFNQTEVEYEYECFPIVPVAHLGKGVVKFEQR